MYTSRDIATTTPGRFTPYFAVIKGQTEADLLELQKTEPNLRPFSVRPGSVDAAQQSGIHPFLPQRSAWTVTIGNALAPAMRATEKGTVSPTTDLAKFMEELANGNGEKLEGEGVEGEDRNEQGFSPLGWNMTGVLRKSISRSSICVYYSTHVLSDPFRRASLLGCTCSPPASLKGRLHMEMA